MILLVHQLKTHLFCWTTDLSFVFKEKHNKITEKNYMFFKHVKNQNNT